MSTNVKKDKNQENEVSHNVVLITANVPTLNAGGFPSKISIKIKLFPHNPHIILKPIPVILHRRSF